MCCGCAMQALEKDLADLKERADAADSLQEQLEQQQEEAAAREAELQQQQEELDETKKRVAHLEFDLHGELLSLLILCMWSMTCEHD